MDGNIGTLRRISSRDMDKSSRSRSLISASLVIGILVSFFIAFASPAGATEETTNDQVCQGLDSGKIDTTGSPQTVTVTAPEGKLIDGYCVKAGSTNNDNGPVYVTVDPPAKTVTISYPGGKDISHYSVSYTDVPPDACPDMPGTQPPGTTCTTPPPPDACPDMPGTQPPGTTCTTPPPPDACPEMPGTQPPGTTCTTPPPPPVTDVCPNMPGNQPVGTVCTTPTPTPVPPAPYVCPPGTTWVDMDHDGVMEQGECKTPVKGAVKKLDKCEHNNFFKSVRVKGGHYMYMGKVVREGVWLKVKGSVAKIKFVADSSKYIVKGKSRFVLHFPNDASCSPVIVEPPHTGLP